MSAVEVLVMSWSVAASASDTEVNATTTRIPAFVEFVF